MSVLGRVFLGCSLLFGSPALAADDTIVGNWVGTAKQGENEFETRLTFVSPKGGVSRYPGYPCGGVLSGDRKGSAYVYSEVITWGGLNENANGCIPGAMRLTVEGDEMKFEWAGDDNGQPVTAEGTLRRVQGP
jgi:hypothetical protein